MHFISNYKKKKIICIILNINFYFLKKINKGEMFSVTTLLPLKEKETIESKLDPKTREVDYNQDFFKKPAYLTVSGQLNVEVIHLFWFILHHIDFFCSDSFLFQ